MSPNYHLKITQVQRVSGTRDGVIVWPWLSKHHAKLVHRWYQLKCHAQLWSWMSTRTNRKSLSRSAFLSHLASTQAHIYYHQAITSYACAGFEAQAPESMRTILRDYASIVGMPRVECSNNYLWPALQLNIASAQHGDSGKCNYRLASAHDEFAF